MKNKCINLLKEYCFEKKILYNRSLYSHLMASYALLKEKKCSEKECLVALLHSIYGPLLGYNSHGLNYSQRDEVKKKTSEEIEKLVYLYNSSQPTKGLLNPEIKEEKVSISTIFGIEIISSTDYNSLINVYILETIEQINYLVKEHSIATYNDMNVHLKKFTPVVNYASEPVRKTFNQYLIYCQE